MQGIFEMILCRVREKAEEFLKVSYGECSEFELQYFMSLTVDNVEKIINEVAAEFNNGWISTKKQLPEEPNNGLQDMENLQEYIVMIDGAETATALYYAGDGEWYRDGVFYKVSAWQSFPECNIEPDKYLRNDGKILQGIISRMTSKSEQSEGGGDETVL